MKVGIIGAGIGGSSILRILADLNSVQVLWITDLDERALGIGLAKEKGISYGKDFLNFLKNSPVDCVIEATGIEKVKKLLFDNVDNHITVIDGQAANLLMEIVSGRDHLIKELKSMAEKLEKDLSSLNDGLYNVEKAVAQIKSGTLELTDMEEDLVNESEKATKAIGKTQEILGFIKSISKQSKILGINSSIEAARAGEAGRGFGVVAEEIRRMADSSEASVEEIQKVIIEIQNNMKSVQLGISNTSEVTHNQAVAVEEVFKLLGKLVDISQEIKEFSEEIVSL